MPFVRCQNYVLFAPLLPEVAVGDLDMTEIVTPLHQITYTRRHPVIPAPSKPDASPRSIRNAALKGNGGSGLRAILAISWTSALILLPTAQAQSQMWLADSASDTVATLKPSDN